MAYRNVIYIRRVANDDQPPNRIRELREAVGLKQAELAERAGMHQTTLSKLELGTRGFGLDDLRRLAVPLGVTPADLLPIEDNPLALNPAERDLILRRRELDAAERDRFDRVADAALPYEAKKA